MTRHPDFIHIPTAGTFGIGNDSDERREWTTLRRDLRRIGAAATFAAHDFIEATEADIDRLLLGWDDLLDNAEDFEDSYPDDSEIPEWCFEDFSC